MSQEFPLRESWKTRAVVGFKEAFGDSPRVVAVCPGRVNLIGEHTDYSFGFVLPAAIPLYTAIGVGPGDPGTLTVVSSAFGKESRSTALLAKKESFTDYLAGALWALGLQDRGLNVSVDSNLPAGSGLSSSASLLVGAVSALSAYQGSLLAPMDAARMAKRIENEFVGVPCGFMDQFAVAMGQEGQALMLDCLDLQYTPVPANLPNAEWVVIFSGLHRELASGGYAVKVDAVKRAVAKVAASMPHKEQFLRYVMPYDIGMLAPIYGVDEEEESVLKHVCSENFRVHRMRYALERGDQQAVGWLLHAGHESLSRLFAVSTPAIDSFVSALGALPGVLGVRLTGAGMGGSLVALVRKAEVLEVMQQLDTMIPSLLSPRGRAYRIGRPCDGVKTWTL